MGEREAIQAGALQMGQNLAGPVGPEAHQAKRRASVIYVEALEGGFIVSTPAHDYGPDRRRLVPNVDALVSVVQCWAHEASNGR